MMAIGLIVLLVGGMALLGGIVQRARAGRLGETPFGPTGQVAAQGRGLASAKGAISTQGVMQAPQVLTSSISGAPCVYFTVRVEAEWPENGADVKYTVLEDAQSVPFAVNDGSGPVMVAIDPKVGGEFSAVRPFERKKFSRGLLAALGSKALEVTPHFSIPASVQVRDALGRAVDVPTAASFYVTEEYLEPGKQVYVNGKLQGDGAIGSPDWASLLVLDKSRDALLASTAGFSKKLFIGGGALAPIGAALALVAHLTAPPMAPVAAATSSLQGAPPSAAAPAAAAAPSPITSSLTVAGGCAALDLAHGSLHVSAASEGVNVVAMAGPTLNRVFLKLGAVTPGETLTVCALGRRCAQNIQVGVGASTFLNHGRGVSGTIHVEAYDVAAGRVSVDFHDVTLFHSNGAADCVVNGTLTTAGLTQ